MLLTLSVLLLWGPKEDMKSLSRFNHTCNLLTQGRVLSQIALRVLHSGYTYKEAVNGDQKTKQGGVAER